MQCITSKRTMFSRGASLHIPLVASALCAVLTCSAYLKLRQANVRAQAKVARARARVCRGLATPLPNTQWLRPLLFVVHISSFLLPACFLQPAWLATISTYYVLDLMLCILLISISRCEKHIFPAIIFHALFTKEWPHKSQTQIHSSYWHGCPPTKTSLVGNWYATQTVAWSNCVPIRTCTTSNKKKAIIMQIWWGLKLRQ